MNQNTPKYMKTFPLSLLFLLMSVSLWGQQALLPMQPVIWLRADQCGDSAGVWKDISGNGYDAVYSDTIPPDTSLFNFHKAFMLNITQPGFKIPYIPDPNSKLTLITVYRSMDSTLEQGIWNIRLDSVHTAGLTTQNLKSFARQVPFAQVTSTVPVINALFQTWLNRKADTTNSFMLLGANDTIGFNGKLAEFMLFDHRLPDKENAKVHTLLALRYGITLYDIPFTAGHDSILWSWDTDAAYHHEVAGIGSDTLLGISQKQSAGDGGQADLGIAAGALYPTHALNQASMPQGCFLVWGHNGGLPAPEVPDTLQNATPFIPGLMQRKWLIRATGFGAATISTQVVYRPQPGDTLPVTALVIDRLSTGAFHPDSVEYRYPDSIDASGAVYFTNAFWDTDHSGSDGFSFIRQWQQQFAPKTTNLVIRSDASSGDLAETDPGNLIHCSLFPNPTPNHYNLHIDLPEIGQAVVTLTDPAGKLVLKRELSGMSRYSMEGYLRQKGVYMVVIQYLNQITTYKLLVY
jgi:hypothetical protein